MRTIATLDRNDYEPEWRRYRRFAVRGVIFRGNKLLMVRSSTDGFYKFPGGGIEHGESHLDTLVRETKEEVGLTIRPDSVRELGRVREVRKSLYRDREIFDHTSYYYYARTSDIVTKTNLDQYEAELGFELAHVSPHEALRVNNSILAEGRCTFLVRENLVLDWLIQRRRKAAQARRAAQQLRDEAVKKSNP